MTNRQYFKIACQQPISWLRAVVNSGATQYMDQRNVRILRVAIRHIARSGRA